MNRPLMPKATAVWLVENTTLTFEQIADFCGMHTLEIQAIADGDIASHIMGLNPVTNNQLTKEDIEKCEKDATARLTLVENPAMVQTKKKAGKKYQSMADKNARLAAVAWLVQNHPELTDMQITKLLHTTKTVVNSVRNNTNKNMEDIQPESPALLGLCSQKDLDSAVAFAVKVIPVDGK